MSGDGTQDGKDPAAGTGAGTGTGAAAPPGAADAAAAKTGDLNQIANAPEWDDDTFKTWRDKQSPEVQEYAQRLRTENQKKRHRATEAERENATLRSQLAEFKSAQDADNEKRLKDQQKYKELWEGEKKRNEEVQRSVIRSEIRSRAVAAGIMDPDVADLISDEGVQYLDGKVSGVETAIETFKTAKPNLFLQAAAAGAAGATPPAARSTGSAAAEPPPASKTDKANTLTMTPQEYEAYKKARFSRV